MDVVLLFLVLLPLLAVVFYWFLIKRNYEHWLRQRVPCMPDHLPGFGHMLPVVLLRENMSAFVQRVYEHGQRVGDASMVGFYFLGRPGVVVREPELVKAVLQTNFASFRSNILQVNERNDPVLAKNPFFINEPHRWRESRARVGGHLTGKKLRGLFAIVQEVCSKMRAFTDRKIKESDESFYECNLKEYFVRSTGEVVANAAFAIQGQNFEDNPDGLSFATMAKTIFEPTMFNGIHQALIFYLPTLGHYLGMSFMQKSTDAYFRENIRAVIEQRRRDNTQNGAEPPNDFLQFCIQSNADDDIDSIVADVITFYLDVYETSSTALSSLFYQLSLNAEVQKKLRTHVREALRGSDTMTYESLKSMQYLEQVLFESMRLLVPVGVLTKICTEPITLTGSDGLSCRLEPGNPTFVPVMGLQRDARYWPEPERFDPERFAPENQAENNKYTFLPFGEGPRMCIGQRLGLMLVKLVAASLILRYEIESSPRTKLPLEMDPTSFLPHVKGGLWARFKELSEEAN